MSQVFAAECNIKRGPSDRSLFSSRRGRNAQLHDSYTLLCLAAGCAGVRGHALAMGGEYIKDLLVLCVGHMRVFRAMQGRRAGSYNYDKVPL